MHKPLGITPASILASGMVVLLASGCASIFGGVDQPVSVTTRTADGQMIAGANCTLENAKGVWYITTPGTLMVHRAYGKLSVSCDKSGQPLGRSFAASSARGWMFGNILFGGVIGIGVDISTGAGYDYPKVINVPVGNTALAMTNSPYAYTGLNNGVGGTANEEVLPSAERDVASGVETMVAAHAEWNALCKVAGPSPAIKVLESTQHGTLQIKQGQFVAPGANPPVACASGKIYGTQIYYESAAGFHGIDHIRYEVASDSGRFTRDVEIAVK